MTRLNFQRLLLGSAVNAALAALALVGASSPAAAQSAAMVSIATDSDNIANSGVINAPAPGSIGLWAETRAGTSCGDNVVNVTGNITATRWAVLAIGCGSSTVNVGTGHSVTSSMPGTVTLWNIATTTATINIDGTIAAPADDEIALVQFGTSSSTTVSGSGLLRGRFIGGDGPDQLTINNGGSWYTAGESDFWTGADVLNNAGTINLTSDATFLDLEEFSNSGTLAIGDSTLSIPNLTSFTNSGTIVLGTGALDLPDLLSFINNGTLSLGTEAQGSAAFARTSSVATGLAATIPMLINNSLVDLASGTTGDILTITNDYAGTHNSSLLMDVGGGAADRLVVGGAASGTTQLIVNKVGAIDSSRILVVDATTSGANAFVIANPALTQLIDLRLEQSGGDYFLSAAPNELAFQPMVVGNLAQDMWYQSADIYSANAALRRSGRGDWRKEGLGLWGDIFWGRDQYGGRQNVTAFGTGFALDGKVETERRGAHVGIDHQFGNGAVVGLTGGFQRAEASQRSMLGVVDADGYSIGAYAQFGGSTGPYGGLLVKVDWTDIRLTDSAFELADRGPDTSSRGLEGDVGYRWSSGPADVDVRGGLAWVRTDIDDFSAEGIDYEFGRSTSIRGRIGARADFRGRLAPFVDARLFHEFNGRTNLTLSSDDDLDSVKAKGRGTWVQLEAGIGGRIGRGLMLTSWAEFGDVKGAGVRAGFRF